MKALFAAAAALACALCIATPAHAQVEDGSLRLYLDISLLSFDLRRTKATTGDLDYVQKQDAFNAGPAAGMLGSAGLGLGFAVMPQLIPTLYFGLQSVKLTEDAEFDGESLGDEETLTFRQFELRPGLEIALVPDAPVVPFVHGGLSLVRRVVKETYVVNDAYPGEFETEEHDTSHFGVGPVLGLGIHGFAVPQASFDLGLTFRGLFVQNDDSEEALERDGFRDIKFREYTIMLSLGISLWL